MRLIAMSTTTATVDISYSTDNDTFHLKGFYGNGFTFLLQQQQHYSDTTTLRHINIHDIHKNISSFVPEKNLMLSAGSAYFDLLTNQRPELTDTGISFVNKSNQTEVFSGKRVFI